MVDQQVQKGLDRFIDEKSVTLLIGIGKAFLSNTSFTTVLDAEGAQGMQCVHVYILSCCCCQRQSMGLNEALV